MAEASFDLGDPASPAAAVSSGAPCRDIAEPAANAVAADVVVVECCACDRVVAAAARKEGLCGDRRPTARCATKNGSP